MKAPWDGFYPDGEAKHFYGSSRSELEQDRAQVRRLSVKARYGKDACRTYNLERIQAMRQARKAGATLGELAQDSGLSRARVAQLTAGAVLEGDTGQ
jgi:hypothetical protein